jgi:glyoxylase-like metal-dependent hydrolase (beta-lactamase superfamily II)
VAELAATPPSPPVTEVAAGVFVATAVAYTTTTTIVAGPDGGCLLIDPAVSAVDLAALAGWLAARGLRPVAGWSTHPHWDHLLWSTALGDVPRYATPRAVDTAANERDAMASELDQTAPGHDHALFAAVSPLPGGEIPWPGPRAMVFAHDGHAPGHGALYLPDTGVLIAGDMCSDIEIPLPDMAGADPFGDYRRGVGMLASVAGVRMIIPGHGHVGDRAEFRRRVAADFCYLDAVESGRDPEDPRLADASPAADWLRAEYRRHRELADEEREAAGPPEVAGHDPTNTAVG